jgi:hydroxymethylpyrimidine pyrophosphatase-like HAD family hydrolase
MHRRFRALATDYDGTIAYGERPTDEILDALAALRRAGLVTILVTGRMGADLRRVFPDVERWFDALVVENGAVVERGQRPPRPLAPPVAPALTAALRARDLAVDAGEVLLALHARHAPAVREESARLGLDVRLVYNRHSLMILPAGVGKHTGLLAALDELGVGADATIAFGDAENDAELLEACGLGVAVGDAVEALKESADIVLDAAGPAGLAAYLRSL